MERQGGAETGHRMHMYMFMLSKVTPPDYATDHAFTTTPRFYHQTNPPTHARNLDFNTRAQPGLSNRCSRNHPVDLDLVTGVKTVKV